MRRRSSKTWAETPIATEERICEAAFRGALVHGS